MRCSRSGRPGIDPVRCSDTWLHGTNTILSSYMILSILLSVILLFLVHAVTALACENDELIKNKNTLVRSPRHLLPVHKRQACGLNRYLKRPFQSTGKHLAAVDECWNIPGSNFTQQTLGPSYDSDSLYNNVAFQSVITGRTVDDDSSLETLPMHQLANVLVEEILLYSETYTFVQQNEYFGRNGEFTMEMSSQHQLLIDFWQVTNDPPILLIGVHSEILQPEGNLENAVAVLSYLHGYQDGVDVTDEVRIVAAQARLAIETELPNGYSNNALTFEDGYFVANFGVVGYEDSSAIVAGDGALHFDVSLGNGAVGRDIFHAHEFAHALQYILDLEDVNGNYDLYLANYYDTISPESSRYSELEADAMAAYALAHRDGRNFPLSLLIEATKSAFAIGDCFYNSDDHHGSPQQRECATKWGADEGLDMIGTPLSPREFRSLFVQTYDKILAVDSSACQLTDDIGDSSGDVTVTPVSSPTEINATLTFHPVSPNISAIFPSSGETMHPTVSNFQMLTTWSALIWLLYAHGR